MSKTALKPHSAKSRRYLGIELSGAKNEKTALAALEYYPKEKKLFLLEIYEQVAALEDQTSDEALLEVIQEHRSPSLSLGVNVPTTLPPCIGCTRKSCPLPAQCSVTTVKWMRDATRRAKRHPSSSRVRDFTPYTQRPVELWIRYNVLPELPEALRFDMDETLGGSRAPLAARMNFLLRHLGGVPLYETLPKLTVAVLAHDLQLNKKIVGAYRQLEDGAYARETILEALMKEKGVFVYQRDLAKLARSLASFDAFLCAYGAWLADTEQTAPPPAGFASDSGWISYPKIP